LLPKLPIARTRELGQSSRLGPSRMPTYVDPHNPDCRITCAGTGGAAFIPPYTCVTWCDDPEPLIKALSDLVRDSGWQSRSSLRANLLGSHARGIAQALINLRLQPLRPTANALQTIVNLSEVHARRTFRIAWDNLTVSTAMQIIAASIQDQLSV
jgi:hypothetical protein